jgi:hypothetical protein
MKRGGQSMEKVVVVTDLGHLKAYRLTIDRAGRKSPRLDLIQSADADEAREKQSEKFTDSAGRFKRDGGQPSGAGYGERHGIAREEEKRLIRSTARTIVSVLRKERCQGWYLAAAKSMNKALLDRLDEEAKGKLEKNLQSDLTNIPKADILRHFDE